MNNLNSHKLEHEDDKYLLALCYFQYGKFLSFTTRYDIAIKYMEKAIEIIQTNLNNINHDQEVFNVFKLDIF